MEIRGHLKWFRWLVVMGACLTVGIPTAWAAKIGGVSVVSPPREVDASWVAPVKQVNANWVAVMPYAFCREGQPDIYYNMDRQWWGERLDGAQEIIKHAKQEGLSVMLKPMIWSHGIWIGEFDLKTEADWKAWEANFRQYILDVVEIANEEKVEMICLGTELKLAVKKRVKFFRALIDEVRKSYSGKLTYAANWDDFLTVGLWDKVDYIGVDAYFPLSPANLPTVNALKTAWLDPVRKMVQLHKFYQKPILFTEFGYRSIDQCCWEQWLRENLPHDAYVNLEAQENAYKAFFESFWHQPWFAGVFFWQWYTRHNTAGGTGNSDFTPQNKPASDVIASWFGK